MLSSESELSVPCPSKLICRSWSMVESTAPLLALRTHSITSWSMLGNMVLKSSMAWLNSSRRTCYRKKRVKSKWIIEIVRNSSNCGWNSRDNETRKHLSRRLAVVELRPSITVSPGAVTAVAAGATPKQAGHHVRLCPQELRPLSRWPHPTRATPTPDHACVILSWHLRVETTGHCETAWTGFVSAAVFWEPAASKHCFNVLASVGTFAHSSQEVKTESLGSLRAFPHDLQHNRARGEIKDQKNDLFTYSSSSNTRRNTKKSCKVKT